MVNIKSVPWRKIANPFIPYKTIQYYLSFYETIKRIKDNPYGTERRCLWLLYLNHMVVTCHDAWMYLVDAPDEWLSLAFNHVIYFYGISPNITLQMMMVVPFGCYIHKVYPFARCPRLAINNCFGLPSRSSTLICTRQRTFSSTRNCYCFRSIANSYSMLPTRFASTLCFC